MSTPEPLKRPPQEGEKKETASTSETNEARIDIGREQVAQYADTVAAYVEQQATAITAGTTEQINRSASTIGLDKSTIEQVKRESGVNDSFAALDEEGRRLAMEMRAEMINVMADVPVAEQESNPPASWKNVFETPVGEVFRKAMEGRAPDGRQDVTRSRITNEFTMREFVRNHPAEARQFAAIYEKEFGEPHERLARANQQVRELEQAPPDIPREDPKFAGLSYALDKDPEFDRLKSELDRAHKLRVFGTTDFTTIPLGRFMDLCNTNNNMSFSADREAENEFRRTYPEKANLYDQREQTRIYRDPDGRVNIDRDPLYLKMFETDSHGRATYREDALRSFVRMYPEKANGYATDYPELMALISVPEVVPQAKSDVWWMQEKIDDRVDRDTSRNDEKMNASKDWSAADWLAQQREMKNERYLAPDPKMFAEIEGAFAEIERQNNLERTFERSPDAPYKSVDTKLIVRAPSLKNWGDSYHESQGRETTQRGENAVIEIGRKISTKVNAILEDPTLNPEVREARVDAALADAGIFREDSFPVYLKGHEGPRGPIYLVQDGSHRVAAAKLVGLDHIRARVGNAPDTQTAKKVWYESLALMPALARDALRAIYDEVYLPTPDEKRADDLALEEAKSRLDELRAKEDLNRQKMEQRAKTESERFRNAEARFNDAQAFADHVKDKKRFQQLRQEAGLQFLIANAPERLWEEYHQEIDEQGYLVRKDGKDSYTASTGYDIGDSYRQIMINAVEAYQREFPAEKKKFLVQKTDL